MHEIGISLSRRHLLGAAGAIALTRPGFAAGEENMQLMPTYARLRGAVTNVPALWWYMGTVWGKPVNDIARPMFLVQGMTFNRTVLKSDGALEQTLTGRGWYADAATGTPLEMWTNPFTSEKIQPPHIKSLQTQNVAADGVMSAREGAAMEVFQGRIGDMNVQGDTLWLTENFVAKSKPDVARGGAVNTSSSLSTFTAKMADVTNRKADFVPCYLSYQSLGSWPAWMKMDGVEAARGGSLSWQTRGHKIRGPKDGPADLRAWINERWPGFLDNPGI
jgi:hypothetical protein